MNEKLSVQNPRAVAADVLSRFLQNHHSLQTLLPTVVGHPQQSLIRELCFGVARWQLPLQAVIAQLVKTPLKKEDHDIYCLLLVGIYQLWHLAVAEHVTVSQTVEAARQLNKEWACGLVNGVLRTFQRQAPQLKMMDHQPQNIRYACPTWLLSALQSAWPSQWLAIVTAQNQRPPLTIRVNCQQYTREAYLTLAKQQGLSLRAGTVSPVACEVLQPCPVQDIPFFTEGACSVQDEAAQLAAGLLQLAPGHVVLDTCAAPGSKTTHLLETMPQLSRCLAIDCDAQRLRKVEQNLQRLALHADCQCQDILNIEQWWDGTPFDRILCDVPCSATGVIRRHPDIKHLRRKKDITELAKTQLAILQAVWPTLKTGGLLLYVTCSILPQENQQVIEQFLKLQPQAEIHPIDAPWGQACAIGRQILPGEAGMDGFYYACLVKM